MPGIILLPKTRLLQWHRSNVVCRWRHSINCQRTEPLLVTNKRPWQTKTFEHPNSIPWEPTTFIFRGYNPYFEGLKPSIFMVLGSKGRWWNNPKVPALPVSLNAQMGFRAPKRAKKICFLEFCSFLATNSNKKGLNYRVGGLFWHPFVKKKDRQIGPFPTNKLGKHINIFEFQHLKSVINLMVDW